MNNRGLQSFLAIAPLALVFALVLFYVVLILALAAGGGEFEGMSAIFSGGLLIGIILTVALIVILHLVSLIYFIIHAVKNPELKKDNMRVLWLIIILLVNTFGPFIYWLVEIRLKDPKPIIN